MDFNTNSFGPRMDSNTKTFRGLMFSIESFLINYILIYFKYIIILIHSLTNHFIFARVGS